MSMLSRRSRSGGSTASAPRRWLVVWALLSVALLGVVPRVVAPTVMGNTIDEAHHHLESWARAYGSADVYPVFRARLEKGGLLPGRLSALEPWAMRVYDAGPVAQRGLVVLTDPQPPLYPVVAELTQWVSGSSLGALRGWSVVFGVLSVGLAFMVGWGAKDAATGAWFAALLGGAALSQWYSGIGRPYTFAQAVLLLSAWAFVAQAKEAGDVRRWRRLLGAGLLAQLGQWMVWPVVGVMLLGGMVGARRAGVSWRALLGPMGWYVPASLLLCGYLAVQLLNPTVSAQAGASSWLAVMRDVSVAGPFAHWGGVGDVWMGVGGCLFVVLVSAGCVAWVCGKTAGEQEQESERAQTRSLVGGVLLLATVVSVLVVVFVNSQWRFQLTLALLPMLSAALALRVLCVRPAWSLAATAVFSGGMLVLVLVSPLERYEVMTTESRFAEVAEVLEASLEDGGRWSAFPYFLTSVVYRYAELPEPALLTDRVLLESWLEESGEGGTLLLTQEVFRPGMPALPEAETVARFPNGYVLLSLP